MDSVSNTTTCELKKTYTKKDGTVTTYTYNLVYERKRPPRSEDEIKEIITKRKNGATIDALCKEYKMASKTYYKYIQPHCKDP